MRRPAGGHAFAAHGHNILANAAATRGTRYLSTLPRVGGWPRRCASCKRKENDTNGKKNWRQSVRLAARLIPKKAMVGPNRRAGLPAAAPSPGAWAKRRRHPGANSSTGSVLMLDSITGHTGALAHRLSKTKRALQEPSMDLPSRISQRPPSKTVMPPRLLLPVPGPCFNFTL